jgi:K+-sensing histidine kinase KdpD
MRAAANALQLLERNSNRYVVDGKENVLMKPTSFSRLAFGMTVALLAVTIQLLLRVLFAQDSYQVFLAAVAVSAIRAGKGNGVFTLAVSVLCKTILFLLPPHSGHGELGIFVDRMITFILMGGAVCWIGGALQESAQRERELLARARSLTGLLPICASCKRIRDDRGSWCQLEAYISNHADVEFSHGFCPKCAAQAWAEVNIS